MAGIQSAAQQVAQYGRGRDTLLAHISPDEAHFIDSIQGGRRTNPMTGLPEYSLFGKILKAVVRVGASVGGFMVGGPAGAALASGAATKLTGGSWKQALKGAALSGIGGELGQGLTGGGWNVLGNNTALANAVSGAGSGAAGAGGQMALSGMENLTPATQAAMDTAVSSGAAAPSMSSVLASAVPETAAAAPSGLGAAVSHIGGYGGLGSGLGALSIPMNADDPAGVQMGGTPPGFGGNLKVYVSPKQRAYRPYTGDYSKYGLPTDQGGAGGWQFYDDVNPAPTMQARGGPIRRYGLGGGVMAPRGPGQGLGGLAGLHNPGIPSQIEAPHMDNPQQMRAEARDLSPAAQRMDIRRAAMMGYVNAKDGGQIQGPGTGTSDSIPAMLSDGEHVIDQQTVNALGHGSNARGHKAIERIKQRARASAGMRHPKKPPAFGGA